MGRRKHKFNRIRQTAPMCPATLCRDLYKNGLTDRFAARVMDSGGPKKALEFNRIRQVAQMCPHGRTHLRYLSNTIGPLSAAVMQPHDRLI